MKTALILSSQVAASRVGASASAFCLQRLGINAIVLPTTLLGRHPGWGPPGGSPISAQHLANMWERIAEQDIQVDAVMTGYMASPEHTELAANITETLRKLNPDLITLVDPVMGDHGKLYVSQGVARAIIEILIPIADIVTPNLWELSYITQQAAQTAQQALKAAQALKTQTLVTSVPGPLTRDPFDTIGAMLCGADGVGWQVSHPAFATTPHGGGDAFTGLFLARLLLGEPSKNALSQSAASIYQVLKRADDGSLPELPLIEAQDALVTTTPLPLSRVTL